MRTFGCVKEAVIVLGDVWVVQFIFYERVNQGQASCQFFEGKLVDMSGAKNWMK